LPGAPIGLEVHSLPVWYDIDDVDDLCRLNDELNGVDLVGRRAHAPHFPAQTAKLLSRLWQDGDFSRRAGDVLRAQALPRANAARG
jgi:hypothetical protein